MYEASKLWQRIMLDNGIYDKEKETLRVAFRKAHENAALLANEISRFLPDFTIHDIVHLDALWKMADVFLPENYPLNPAEVFVLGISFLIHDLGMSLAAYPDGMEGIQKENLWKDTVASLCKRKGLDFDFEKPDTIDQDIRREATEVTIRSLHAKKAEHLGLMAWNVEGSNGVEQLYIIEDRNLRSGYGEIIGKIAASHGCDIEKVAEELSVPAGAISSLPVDWIVNPLKLACIVRIADAINIDDSRAPELQRTIRKPRQRADLHWVFQGKLSQAQLINNRIAFSSTSAFCLDERDAWWLCHDTLKWIDLEIRKVDSTLLQNGLDRFGCIGIHSIDNISDLQKMIKVNGWNPVDTRIRATKVAHLVKTLGGDTLYGDAKFVPLRELIQNASDAIRARRSLENDDYGTITITIGNQNEKKFLEIEDNGVGMSENTLVNTLLDFGHSFWGTDEMHMEFPGLERTQFKSTGRFGIGFFSVFMWGEHVTIATNRYDLGRAETKVLEFVAGADKRPFLRNAHPDECIKNGGTRVRVYISDNAFLPDETEFADTVSALCPSIDCNIDIVINGAHKTIIQANDWMTIDPLTFYKRSTYFNRDYLNTSKEELDYLCNSFRLIYENEKCIGRACVSPKAHFLITGRGSLSNHGAITIGGMYSCNLDNGMAGIIVGDIDRINASRDNGIPLTTNSSMASWTLEQAELINKSELPDIVKLDLADTLCRLSSVDSCVKLAGYQRNLVCTDEITRIVEAHDFYECIICPAGELKYISSDAIYSDNVFLCPLHVLEYSETTDKDGITIKMVRVRKRTSLYHIIIAIAKGWKMNNESFHAKINEDGSFFSLSIESVKDKKIGIYPGGIGCFRDSIVFRKINP